MQTHSSLRLLQKPVQPHPTIAERKQRVQLSRVFRHPKVAHLHMPARKKANVKEYIASTNGKLTMRVFFGYTPDLNPDRLVWSPV